jgi:hypothetical protein
MQKVEGSNPFIRSYQPKVLRPSVASTKDGVGGSQRCIGVVGRS